MEARRGRSRSGFFELDAPGQQRLVVVGGLGQWQAGEDMPQVLVRLDTAGLGRFDERVQVGAGLGAGDGVAEQPVLPVMRSSA